MDRRTALIAAAFVLLWNSGFIGAEQVLPHAGPFTQIFWRYLLLAGALAVWLLVKRKWRWPGATVAGVTAAVGVLAHAVWLGSVLLALESGVPAGIVALVIALQPLFTGLFSSRVTGESISPVKWSGLCLGFCGVVFTVVQRLQSVSAELWLGYLLPFLAALAMASATLIQRRVEIISPRFSLPLGLTLFYQSLASAGVLFLPALWVEGLRTDWTPQFIVGQAWLIGAVSFGAYGLMWRLLQRIDATRVESLFYLGPPVTMLMAWLVLGDTLQKADLIGLGIVLLGVLITTRRPSGAY